MGAKPPELKSVVQLVKKARLYPCGALLALMHQSFPVPVPGPTGLQVAFFYGRGEVIAPREGLKLFPPTYVAFLEAETGRFVELRAVAAGEFGLPADDTVIGKYLSQGERLAAEFLTKEVKLYQAYDVLLPAFAAGSPVPASDVRKVAGEFNVLFPQVTEAPLQPCYQALGKAFFAWVNRVAGR
jgi:hypothetical protein